jgi:hypothetical protein
MRFSSTRRRSVAGAALALTLSACGGGGDSSTPPTPTPPPIVEVSVTHKVRLSTTLGVIELGLDRTKAPRHGGQLPGLCERALLQRHRVSSRHQGLRDPGRRLRTRGVQRAGAKAHACSHRAGEQQGTVQSARHHCHGAHFRPQQRHQPVLHQHGGQQGAGLPRQRRQRRLRGVRQGDRRAGCGGPHPCGGPPARTCRWSTSPSPTPSCCPERGASRSTGGQGRALPGILRLPAAP